jgi:Prolyl oligopeptidase family
LHGVDGDDVLFTASAEPAETHLWLYRPADGLKRLTGEPGVHSGLASRQRVTADLDWQCLVSQWFAEQGFAGLVADGRGTPGRGPGWEREVHGDPFGPVLDDQVTALHEAARGHPDLDLPCSRRTRCGCPARCWPRGGRMRSCCCPERATRTWGRALASTCCGISSASCSDTWE